MRKGLIPKLAVRSAVASVALVAFAGLANAADERWVQYSSNGLEVRVATAAAACPTARVDGRNVALSVRSTPGPDFPVRICAATLPAGTRSASIEGAALPLPKARPDKILLIGDTGCRISTIQVQACNDPKQWPFAEGSAKAADTKPDLVIHLGDFQYRERACPLADRGCKGSPYGDNWAVWMADFFEPARSLLQAAPWVMVRGNHEECQRGGKGWSRALDPYPFKSANGCLGLGQPFTVDLGGVTLAILDTATAGELRARPNETARFRKQFESLERLAPTGPIWLAFHRPIWSVAASFLGIAVGGNASLAAASSAIPARTDMILSGHLHTFQILDFADDLPVQVVSGHGGNELHLTASNSPAGLTVQGAKIRSGKGASGVFGYAILERKADGGWSIANRSFDGKLVSSCELVGRRIACK